VTDVHAARGDLVVGGGPGLHDGGGRSVDGEDVPGGEPRCDGSGSGSRAAGDL
jgi:hypothetical protein